LEAEAKASGKLIPLGIKSTILPGCHRGIIGVSFDIMESITMNVLHVYLKMEYPTLVFLNRTNQGFNIKFGDALFTDKPIQCENSGQSLY
jgi:hypothetical protein